MQKPPYIIIKRFIDILAAFLGLLLLLPFLLVISLIIRLKMERPVLFKQSRPGLKEKPFTIFKFRTMSGERMSDGTLLPDVQRLTAFGQFLRKTSMDELPELWNVLIGDMSLIGPRPLLMKYLPYYTNRERARFLVRPGITGLAQVMGRNTLDWDERLELDVQYIENTSFVLDIKLLVKTVAIILKRENVELNILEDFDDFRKSQQS
ncbi:MAG: sugar transferase [Candidatus Hatepunaea meridiana]|nr:sugar transferase [Candidatus Hatepunaea meridiana]